ncbi:C6 transcription factor, putative [Talaromyces stipitatus ATCC 10500]|uniref:C6 transcription factor, putative n=1 Tax=Talaromyces stipitatus (strain ATCC 10500 / CBS 375.48 / QM 6759 / NRRL 1006) TaxID=441959 RepID=B8M2X3_TALSN|nr:C6 transcription factor, putative [Talaromyces stipitatus ATCC 10500]EED22228.1 C6 transcription factor, putative [Talaromyces stipitatus ATCC 10500]
MSRQQKILFPKINSSIPGYRYPESINTFNRRGDEKPTHRVFRTKRKHVQRACERCRVKKAKCDGNQPCSRCVTYNQACIFRDRKATQEKVYSRGFVEMLISQHAVHIQALRDLYKRCVRREGFPGSPLQESIQGYPGTHAILDRLGLIKHAEEAIEDPQKVLADIVEYIKRLDPASDCCLDSVESTTDTSETTVSEELSPEPNTPRESPDLSVPSNASTWKTATSEEARLCHAYGDYKPMHSQYAADIPLAGSTDDACAIRTDDFTEVSWNYYPSQVRYTPAGTDTASYTRTESFESSWPEIADHPSATFMPMTSRATASEPLIYTTEQSDFSHGYAYTQGHEHLTGPIQREHQHQHQHQRQLRHSVDYGLMNTAEHYVYL